MVRESRVGKSKEVPIVSMYYKAVPREMMLKKSAKYIPT